MVVIKLLTTSPVVSWRGWETPPTSITAQLSFFAQSPLSEHLSLCVDCPSLDVLFTFGGWVGFSLTLTEMSIIFFLFSLVSYVRVFTYVLGWDTAVGRDLLLPFFLGVALGLLLRIKVTYVRIGLRRSGKLLQTIFWLVQVFVFALQALSSPAPMSFPHAGTSSKVTHPGAFPSSPSLPSEGRDEEGGGSRDVLVLLPEGLPLLPIDFCPARGMEEPLVARSVRASSLLSPRFIHGLGVQGVARLQRIHASHSVSVGSPSSSLHALRGDGAGGSSEARSVLGCLSLLISLRPVR